MRLEVIIYTAALIIGVLGTSVAFGAGSTTAVTGELAGKILGNAWYRDGSVQVVVCNASDSSQQVRVVIGVYDTSPRGIFQQRLTIKDGVASQLTFPIVQRQSPRGDTETANFIFIYRSTAPEELVASIPIQNKPIQGRPVLNQYMAWSGDTVTVSLAVANEPHLRLFAVGKGIVPSGPALQGQLSMGSITPASIEDIRGLDLPQQSKKQYIDRMEDEFVFVLRPGDSGWLAVDYEIPSVKGCTIVILPIYRTNIETGEGPISSSLLVLNKQEVVFQPALIMEPATDSLGKTKTVK